MDQMHIRASFIPHTFTQKRGERLFATLLSHPNRETGPTAVTPSHKCSISALRATAPWLKGAGPCVLQKQPLNRKEKDASTMLPIIYLRSLAHLVVEHSRYQLWDLKLTARRCPRATERPMARGADPETSVLLRSVVARTHKTSWRVAMISIPSPWPALTPPESYMETRRKMSADIPTCLQPDIKVSGCLNRKHILLYIRVNVASFCCWYNKVVASSQSEHSATRHNENVAGVRVKDKWVKDLPSIEFTHKNEL